jgi:histidyl-tRNA synthetase
MKIDNSPARGMRDLLPADVAVRDHVLESIMAVYRRFGYQRIETPALEDINRLQSGEGADNEKLIYQVLRRGLPPSVPAGTSLRELVDLGLRYDLTVPLTRFYGNNHASLPSPFRSLQVGPVWRAERPQRGRYRQFYQCDIDMIGEASVLAEAELIEATTDALAAIGLTGTTVRLSDRRFLSALAADCGVPESLWTEFFIALDRLDRSGWDGVRSELTELGLSAAAVSAVEEKIQSLVDVSAEALATALSDSLPKLTAQVIDDLATTASCLDRLASERGLSWEFDPSLVRGMGYYTGQVFEITHPDMPSSVAGGGRYDKLIGRSLGHDVPACGFSLGFERIVDLLARRQSRDAIAVLVERDVPLPDALEAARELRAVSEAGRVVETVLRSGKFGAQLNRLELAGFSGFVLVSVEDGAVVCGELRTLGLQVHASPWLPPGQGRAARGGGDGQHPGEQAQAVVVEDRVVNGVAARGPDGAEVVDHLPRLEPRGADRDQERADRILWDRERVARVEQVAVDQEAGVDYPRDVLVNQSVVLPVDVHGEASHLRRVAVPDLMHPVAELAELRGDRRVGPQRKVRVGPQRGAYSFRVEMVRVLVGNQDRGGSGQGRGRVAP